MPAFNDIASALKQYGDRYRFLDAFVDDIEEFQEGTWQKSATVVQTSPTTIFSFIEGNKSFTAEVFENGVVRFRRGALSENKTRDAAIAGAALGAALGAASARKDGLLGGLALGLLVGGLYGAATSPREDRVLALRFDEGIGRWRLYDGALRGWAKQNIMP